MTARKDEPEAAPPNARHADFFEPPGGILHTRRRTGSRNRRKVASAFRNASAVRPAFPAGSLKSIFRTEPPRPDVIPVSFCRTLDLLLCPKKGNVTMLRNLGKEGERARKAGQGKKRAILEVRRGKIGPPKIFFYRSLQKSYRSLHQDLTNSNFVV